MAGTRKASVQHKPKSRAKRASVRTAKTKSRATRASVRKLR